MGRSCLSAAAARCVAVCLLMPSVSAHARQQAPAAAATVDELHERARALAKAAATLEAQGSANAASKYAEAAAADAEALELERDTPHTWDRRHVIFCAAMRAWNKAFDLGLRSRPATELALATAQAYGEGLQDYPDRDAREPECKSGELRTRASQLMEDLPEAPAPAPAPGDPGPPPAAARGDEGATPPKTAPQRPTPARPGARERLPSWQLGLLPTFATLAVAGAGVAIGLGVQIHQGQTLASSGPIYQDLFNAVARSHQTVPEGGELCTSATRMDASVDEQCGRALQARSGMVAASVIGSAAIVGTGVLAGMIARHRRITRSGARVGVAWQPGGVTAQLRLAF